MTADMGGLTFDAADAMPPQLYVTVRVRRSLRFRLGCLLMRLAGRLWRTHVEILFVSAVQPGGGEDMSDLNALLKEIHDSPTPGVGVNLPEPVDRRAPPPPPAPRPERFPA
jgi:hypothetical protein